MYFSNLFSTSVKKKEKIYEELLSRSVLRIIIKLLDESESAEQGMAEAKAGVASWDFEELV